MVSTFNTSQLIGPNFARRTTVPEFALGTVVQGDENASWIYVQATATVATGTCTVNATTFVVTDAAGTYTADVAFAAGEYGWVRQTAGTTA